MHSIGTAPMRPPTRRLYPNFLRARPFPPPAAAAMALVPFFLAAVISSAVLAEPSHTIESVGAFPTFEQACFVNDVNEHGHVVGYFTALGGSMRAFLNRDGILTDLGAGYANGLNDYGQIVGTLKNVATIWTGDVPSSLPGAGTPLAINNPGLIVGVATVAGTGSVACIWRDGERKIIGAPVGKTNSIATAVNDKGQVVGYAFNGSVNDSVAFFWTSSAGFTNLGFPSGTSEARAWDINEGGQIALMANPGNRTFLWDPLLGFQDTSFPTSGGFAGINDFGCVVGYLSWYARGFTGALSNLVEPSSGWSVVVGRHVNSRGVIVGTGMFQGKTWGYIMRPQLPSPEASLQIFKGTELQLLAPNPTKVYSFQDSPDGQIWTTRERIPGCLHLIQRFRAHDDPAKTWRLIEEP